MLAVAALLGVLLVAGATNLNRVRAAHQYLLGSQPVVEARFEGEGCGSHVRWSTTPIHVAPGTRVHFVNDSRYWQFPVAIVDREGGHDEVIASSPALANGQSWTYTFWEPGEYLMTSNAMLRLAGLEGTVIVEGR
jgi:plastocyanin